MQFEPPERFNIAHYFLEARLDEGHGQRRALITAEGEWTYRQVDGLASHYGRTLSHEGVRVEDRVIIALADGAQFVGAFFGALKLGAVVVMVNPAVADDELNHFLAYTRATTIVVGANEEARFRTAATRVETPPRLLVAPVEVHCNSSPDGAHLRAVKTHRDDAAIWLFSGGTTGRPKGVIQSHWSFANTTECYAKGVMGYCPDDITISVPKLYFGYGTGANLLFPFSVGATAILFPEKPTAERLFDLIAEHRATLLINVPTVVTRMVNHERATDADLSSLRAATSAGEALPPSLGEAWDDRFGVPLLDGLGTAEMWHIFVTNRVDDAKPGTLGRVVPGFEIRVCDPDGTEVPPGEVGTMWVRGNSRAIGYWQHSQKDRLAFRGVWYVSGDLVSMDVDGYLTYRGRSDDMIKVAGQWVAPGEIEDCLLRHEAVRECAVVGASDSRGLVKAHAFVTTETDVTETALQTWVHEHLAAHKTPASVHFLDEFPRTHLGKVDRNGLRQRLSRRLVPTS